MTGAGPGGRAVRLAAGALAAATLALLPGDAGPERPRPDGPPVAAPAAAAAVALARALPAGLDDAPAQDEPGTAAGTGTAGEGDPSSYELYRNPDGSAVRFDPCRPLVFRVNAPTATAAGEAREALARLREATGLDLVDGGDTAFVPTRGQRTEPGTDLVVAWSRPGAGGSDFLDGAQLGTGGWSTVGERSAEGVRWRATSGFAVLDATRDGELEPGFGPGLSRGALLLHEISHALGVDHVDDATQLMAPVLQRRETPVALGAGDRAALRAVGAAAGCLPG